MLRHYQPPNSSTMDALQKKELLHLRIEQANEQVLDVLAEMAETLFKTWQPEVVDEKMTAPVPELTVAEYEANLKPMTVEELTARAEASNEDIAAGRIHSLEEVEKMFSL